MKWNIPRIIISGLSGGCGKTFVSIGIASVLHRRGVEVSPFKKGPDYIDSAWLSRASASQCYNLDTFLMGSDQVTHSFELHTGITEICRFCDDSSCADCDRLKGFAKKRVALIEGNRGIFDGMDENGTYSTAELAKLLKSPVILVLDSTKATRTLAAEVLGCQRLDADVHIEGIILNRIAGKRHEQIARSSIEGICGIPVIGAIPKLEPSMFPERHLGLITPQEYTGVNRAITYAADIIKNCIDVDKLILLASRAGQMSMKKQNVHTHKYDTLRNVNIGIIRDPAFSFYYPDNIEALMALGARIVEINALKDPSLPDIDALYIGGGFPETNARALADNKSFRISIKKAVEEGLPVYAECGGAIYMGRSLTYRGITYPMTNVLPVGFDFDRHPQGHGYTILEVKHGNPYFELSSIVHGHEFHYSRAVDVDQGKLTFIFKVQKGYGFNKTEDGICYKNLLAVYSHVHAAGTPQWAENMVRSAGAYAVRRKRYSRSEADKSRQYDCLRFGLG